MIRILNSFLILFFLAGLVACDSNRIYETNQNFTVKYWHKDSAKTFTFRIEDNALAYNLYFNLRNTSSYPYQNLYVQYELRDSSNRVLETELRDFQLFHPQTGAPFGKSGVGDIFDHQFLLLEKYRFPAIGNYKLLFTQMMRKDTLSDILSVGARVEIYPNKN